MCNIAVVGLGYVGLSLAVLLSRNNIVLGIDIDKHKVQLINNRISPINDKDISEALKNDKLFLHATAEDAQAYVDADYIIICAPTDYNSANGQLKTEIIESIIDRIWHVNRNATIIIKSTVPIGFTNSLHKKFSELKIIFCPEFLREGKALQDNLQPSRIILGLDMADNDMRNSAEDFANLLLNSANRNDVEVLIMGYKEAESVKLFANAYLAMRVAYFNELDTFACLHSMDASAIIRGVSLDPRIGDFYNNPSFGFGGYCLPKDVRQLSNMHNADNSELIKSIWESNQSRKKYIAKVVIDRKPKIVGIYRLTAKSNSDNFRDSAVLDIIEILKSHNVNMIIFEPLIEVDSFRGCKVVNELNSFKSKCDLIIVNRIDSILEDVSEKVLTRDVYLRD